MQDGQQGGQMFLAMAKVMVEVIALGFEGVVVFVFDLPPGPGRGILPDDFEVGDEAVAVKNVARRVGYGVHTS